MDKQRKRELIQHWLDAGLWSEEMAKGALAALDAAPPQESDLDVRVGQLEEENRLLKAALGVE